jgi:hypothetical protein
MTCPGLVAHYAEVGGGDGGYNQDHEFFGYRQFIQRPESDRVSGR